MKCHNSITAESLFHFRSSLPITLGCPDVVTSRKNMAGVHADSQPGWMFGRLDDCGEVFKSVAETRTLAGSGFQGDFDRAAFRGGEHFIEALCCVAQITLCAGMQDNEWHTKKCRAFDFINERDD